ncbi:MAG TPA: TetR/AcrR family transcriptional regulator [Ktedonobacteraceae bacterium]|jgi:AcrR family transcriptional regulator|nr:TetR/AcrR family transcriptional regulator [Ktedonobacteraceae bacterium]
MEIQDRRIRRTQQLLAKALIALTLEKGYEAVTIRDITEHADIGYATFFRHYHDKEELLKDVMDVVLTELIDLLCPAIPDDPTIMGILLFRYVQDHSEVIRVLLRSHALLQHTIEIATRNVAHEHTPLPGSAVPLEVAAHHIVTSSISLIQWWLDQQMPYPPERMGRIYHELITRPTSVVAFAS